MTSAASFQPHQAPSSSSKQRLSTSGLFQNQAPGPLPTADALFEALAMQNDPPADPAGSGPLSVHVQQLPTPRTSFSSGANSPPENLSPQSQYTHQPYLPHHLSSSQVTPTSMISAASSSVSTPSTDYPSTLASPNNNNNNNNNYTFANPSDFMNGSASSSTWNTSSSTTYSSSGAAAKTLSTPYQPQSYPSLRSTSPAIPLGPALYGPSSVSNSGASSSSIGNQYNGPTAYNMGTSSLSQTSTSSYTNINNNSTSTINFGPNDHAYSELHEELYYDEKEQQKKNARSALNNVASFLPPAVSQSLTKVVQQAQAVVTNSSKMSLPTTFGSSASSTPSVTSLDPTSVRGMLLKLYKASKLPLLCLAWYLSSAVTNNIGKQIMNQFRYPVTLTFIQFLFVSLFCFLSGTMGLTKIRSPTVGIMQMTAPLVGFQVVGHVFSSVAISRVPLSVVHTIKALSPLFTVVFYRIILGTTYSRAVYISLVPLTAGVMLACRLSLEFNNLVGLVCALASTLVFVTQNVFTKRILFSTKAKQQSGGLGNKDNGEDSVDDIGSSNAQKLDKLNILFYSSTFAAICMVPIWLYAEGMGLMFPDESGVYHHPAGHQAGLWSVAWLLFLNGFSHFFQSFSVLALTSPVTYSIASLIKRIIVIVASIVYFHQTLGTTQWMGVCLTFWGLWLYNSAKNAAKVSAPLGIISNTKLGRRVSRNFGGRGMLDERSKGGFLA
ncbi:suppressor of loss of ypt1 [Podila verticillata]|nr:suppressor of loss of ypt1 [Podila verticillata]